MYNSQKPGLFPDISVANPDSVIPITKSIATIISVGRGATEGCFLNYFVRFVATRLQIFIGNFRGLDTRISYCCMSFENWYKKPGFLAFAQTNRIVGG
jgi:hypothetical protein